LIVKARNVTKKNVRLPWEAVEYASIHELPRRKRSSQKLNWAVSIQWNSESGHSRQLGFRDGPFSETQRR
jgi:hypothetical protein